MPKVGAFDWWTFVQTNALDALDLRRIDVDQRGPQGETALHVAASRGWDTTVLLLLEHGADPRRQDRESGWTALHRAVYHRQISTTLVLLRYARWKYGAAYAKEYLYEVQDAEGLSAMELMTATTMQEDAFLDLSQERNGGMVYTFGKVDFQLGYHLPHMNVQSSPRVVGFPLPSPIAQVSASRFHTIALNRDGQVFVWGFGKGGRLGTGTQHNCIEPTLLAAFDEIPIAKVAAGENHSLALSCSGQVFSWGSNSFGQLGHHIKSCTQDSRLLPKRIDAFRGQNIVEIAASGCHSAAICDQHYVFTWGSNRKGQLGQKEGFGSDQPCAVPRRVDRLVSGHPLSVVHEPHDSLYAVQVAMSDVHTCVILRLVKQGHSHGQVWQFGNGSNIPSRVIFQDEHRTQGVVLSDIWVPRWMMQRDDIMAVSCAQNHSMALSACGAVYTWGHNGDALSHHQVPDCPAQIPGAPQRVELDHYGPISHICASSNHCAAVTRDGNLITWGYGPQGVLGHGPGNSWQPLPKHVHGAKKVCAVAMGHQHTVLLVCPQIPSFPVQPTSAHAGPQKLRHILESFIANHVDLSNVATVWKYAEVLAQTQLERYCYEYMQRNWDALLEMGGKDRLEALNHLMLPEDLALKMEKNYTAGRSVRAPSDAAVVSLKDSGVPSATVRKASMSCTDEVETEPAVKIPGDAIAVEKPPPVGQQSSALAPVRRKATKFIPLNEYLQHQHEAKTTTADGNSTATPPSPWQKPTAAPTETTASTPAWMNARVPRKSSIDLAKQVSLSKPRTKSFSSPKPTLQPQVVPGGEYVPPPSTFSLDAYIVKKDKKKKGRKMSSENLACSWGASSSIVSNEVKSKPLRDIQADEEAAAKAEAMARAKLGAWAPKKSSINHWGLVEQTEHVSLAELQQREEQERLVAEQQAILVQIQKEAKQREQAGRRNTTAHPPDREKKKKSKTKAKPKTKPSNARGNKEQEQEQVDPNTAGSKSSLTFAGDKHDKKERTRHPRRTNQSHDAKATTTHDAATPNGGASKEVANRKSHRPRKSRTGAPVSSQQS